MNESYIKKDVGYNSKGGSFLEFLYTLCQICCIILTIYYCWYVEAFGNWGILVNSTFLTMSGCIILIWVIEGSIQTDIIPYGIWSQLVMIIYCVLTGLITAYSRSSLLYAIRKYLIYFVIIYAICLVAAYKSTFQWFLKSIIFAILICCYHLMFHGFHYASNRIVLSSNNNPNLLGVILNLGLFAVLVLETKKNMTYILKIPLTVIILYNIIMTGSRKSFLASMILLFFWGVALFISALNGDNMKKKLCVVLFLAVMFVAFKYIYNRFLINTAVYDRLQSMYDDSYSTRIQMYKYAVDVFFNKPLFGGGLDQYKYWTGTGRIAHSTYAEAIADFGFIGSVIYFIPFLLVFYKSLQSVFCSNNLYRAYMIMGFCIVELFLGVGQIWFMEACHFFAWAMIFLMVHGEKTTNRIEVKAYKIVRDYRR